MLLSYCLSSMSINTHLHTFFETTDSTSNLTGQNSLETQVVNQCSRAIVRNVMSKVVVDCCPTNQENCENHSFSSKDKQTERDKHDFRIRTMVNRDGASCDSQTALTDNSTNNLNNSVYSPSNVEENEIKRYDLYFDHRLTYFNCILLLNQFIYIQFI